MHYTTESRRSISSCTLERIQRHLNRTARDSRRIAGYGGRAVRASLPVRHPPKASTVPQQCLNSAPKVAHSKRQLYARTAAECPRLCPLARQEPGPVTPLACGCGAVVGSACSVEVCWRMRPLLRVRRFRLRWGTCRPNHVLVNEYGRCVASTVHSTPAVVGCVRHALLSVVEGF